MEIKRLREFIYLAETLSFSVTARHFFISSSVFSKHVAALEAELGVKLLERDRHHVELTAAGERFYRDASLVVNDYDSALSNLKALASGSSQLLRIGYLRGAAGPFLLELLRYCDESHPDIDVAVTCMEYGELIRAHRSHKVDVGLNLLLDPEARAECDCEPIYADRLHLVVGRDHRLAARSREEGAEIADLRGERIILPDRVDYPGLAEMVEEMVEPVLPPDRCERYRDSETMMLRIATGGCVGFSSGHNAARHAKEVAFVPLAGVDSSYDIGALWFKGMDAGLAAIARDVALHCREFMDGQG